MRVLLFGSGAREHALADKILKSPLCEKLYLASSGAFSDLGEVIEFSNYNDLSNKALNKGIDLLVVGPEAPLVDGICDVFLSAGIKVIGADKYWANLEGSKIFAKEFMKRNEILTADYQVADDISQLQEALNKFKKPPVIKADGLAKGKGVYVAKTFDEAYLCAEEFLKGKFNSASKRIIIEEKLEGKEYSLFSLWDGKTLMSFPLACDYKRLLDNDKGPNTGGMGAAFPCKCNINAYLKTLEAALNREKADFCAVIYSALMISEGKIYVLEYNMRFGDPEIQAVLENLQNDILEIFDAAANRRLNEVILKFKKEPSYCVVLASEGYPENPKTGSEITGIDEAKEKYGVKVYFAGAKKDKGRYYVNGGRVLSIVKSGFGALDDIYKAAQTIKFEGKIFRHDINLR